MCSFLTPAVSDAYALGGTGYSGSFAVWQPSTTAISPQRAQRAQSDTLEVNQLSSRIIGAAIAVHRELGPGLLESTYEKCLTFELTRRRIPFARQKVLPVTYAGVQIDTGYRIDFVVDQRVIVELKSIERFEPIHCAQLLTYL